MNQGPFPGDVWLLIAEHCDNQTVYRLFQTCKYVYQKVKTDNLILKVIDRKLKYQSWQMATQPVDYCLARIKKNPDFIARVKKQTPELCLAAVSLDGNLIRFVEDQTPEICMAAIKQDCWSIRYVKNLTPELYLTAVQQNGNALQLVKNQTPEICLAALQNGGSWKDVSAELKKSSEFYEWLVKQDGMMLRFIPHYAPICYMHAVSQNGLALKYVPEWCKTREICLASVRQNGLALKHAGGFKTAEVCFAAWKQNNAAGKYFPFCED